MKFIGVLAHVNFGSNPCLQTSFELRCYPQQAKKNLLLEQCIASQGLHSIKVETIFGDIKHNMGLHRFMPWSLKNVQIELDLVCIAHNLRKLAIP